MCGMKGDVTGDHTLACQRNPCRIRIHNSVRDRLAQQLRRWEQRWAWEDRHHRMRRTPDEDSRFKLAQIDIVVTIHPGEGGARMDVTIRLSISSNLIHAAAPMAEYAADKEREKQMKCGKKTDMGPDTVKLASYELERRGTSRQT